jgi:surface antigen
VAGARRFGYTTAGAALALTWLGLLGGCSVTLPMASLLPNHHDADDDATGSIAKPEVAGWLDDADWTSAKPAFSRALDAQQSVTTNWDNPTSGAKGTFVALGRPYTSVSGHCRTFRADIDRPAKDHFVEGTACADQTGDWQVTELKPSSKG